MENFGDRLRIAIAKKKIKQTELQELLGLKGKQTVSNWVNNYSKPSADDLLKLANALEVSTDWLLTGKSGYNHNENEVSITNEEYQEYQKLKIEKLKLENEGLKNHKNVLQQA